MFIFFRTTSNLTDERVLEMASDKEPLCNVLEEHDSSTVVGSTTSSHKELDGLHIIQEMMRNSPNVFVNNPPTGKAFLGKLIMHSLVMLTSVLPIAYQPKTFFGGTTYFDLKRTTVVCSGHRLSKHKMTQYARNLVGAVAPWPPLTAHVSCQLLTVMC